MMRVDKEPTDRPNASKIALIDRFHIFKNSFNTIKLAKKQEGLEQLQTQAQNEHLQLVQTEMTPQNLQNLHSQFP